MPIPTNQPNRLINGELKALLDRFLDALYGNRTAELGRLLADESHFKPDQWEAILTVIREIRGKSASPLFDALWQIDFKQRPVSIDTFLDDPHYLGKVGASIHKVGRDELRYVCDPKNRITEWAISGAIGIGKTTWSMIALLYRGVYYLSCMRDASQYYGLMGTNRIAFGLYSVYKYVARDVNLTALRNMVEASPYFKSVVPFNSRMKTDLEWPSANLEVVCGSTALDSIGRDVFSICMDEASFWKDRTGGQSVFASQEEIGAAAKLYNDIHARMASRFGNRAVIPGIMLIVSSRRSTASFLDKHIHEVRGLPGVHISEFAQWDVLPAVDPNTGRRRYSGKKFIFRLPTRNDPGRVMQRGERIYPGEQWIPVPVEHREAFLRNPISSTQDFAGLSTEGFNKFFESMEPIKACIDHGRRNPFPETVSLPRGGGSKLQDHITIDDLCRIRDSQYQPRHYPDKPRAIHIDGSLSGDGDATGICMAAAVGTKVQEVVDFLTGEKRYEVRTLVHIDFFARIKASKGEQISLLKILELIPFLSSHLHFPIQCVTYDGFQSAMQVEVLSQLGFHAEVFSVDRDMVGYETTKGLFSEQCINMPDHNILFSELSNLEVVRTSNTRTKVDHPATKGASKDLADALAAAVYRASQFKVTGTGEGQFETRNVILGATGMEIREDMRDAMIRSLPQKILHMQQPNQEFLALENPIIWISDAAADAQRARDFRAIGDYSPRRKRR